MIRLKRIDKYTWRAFFAKRSVTFTSAAETEGQALIALYDWADWPLMGAPSAERARNFLKLADPSYCYVPRAF